MKRGNLSLTKEKETEMNKVELNNNLEILKDGLIEIENRFVFKNNELNNVTQRIRDIRNYNETNLSDITEIML